MDLKDVRARTLAGQPVRGIAEIAREIHVHRGKASDAVAQLEEKAHVHRTAGPVVAQLKRDKLIEDEPEKSGRGDPKPRLWALTTADFTAPPRPGRAQ
jgi:hypothetical protein